MTDVCVAVNEGVQTRGAVVANEDGLERLRHAVVEKGPDDEC
ncbi:hypothetical protein [Klebsiella pneumoniae]|nr:hypothetical protein [Klebsiella pneumoniae]